MTRDELIETLCSKWSAVCPGDDEHSYDSIKAGDYSIEWKSWKQYPVYTVCHKSDPIGVKDSLAAAKKLAAEHQIDSAISTLSEAIPGLSDVIDGKAVIVPVEPTFSKLAKSQTRLPDEAEAAIFSDLETLYEA